MKKVKKEGKEKDVVFISPPKRESITVRVVGDTGYVGTRFSEKIREDIIGRQTGKYDKVKVKSPRNIEEEVYGRRYIINEVDCIPARAFQAAMEEVAKNKMLTEITGTTINRNVFVKGEFGMFVPIKGENGGKQTKPSKLESIIKIKGQPGISFRPEHAQWSATITIVYMANFFSKEDILNLLIWAGSTIGVGDNRKVGGGRFHIEGKEG